MCRPIEILTVDEVRELLRACSPRAPTGIRNRALIVLGWRAGLRVGEALSLLPRDLDPDVTRADLFDPYVNAALGLRYLRELIDEHDGDVHLALLSYNRGPNRVASLLARGRDPDNGYSTAVCRGPCDGRL